MNQSANRATREEQQAELQGLVRIILFGLLEPFFSAFVLLYMWRWFITPLGVISISYWHSLGLAILFMFLKNGLGTSDGGEDTASYWVKRYKATFIKLPIYFVAAWVVHLMVHGS